MKYYISYFGQMRNFPSNLLPVSTVMWEQAWFAGTIEKLEELIVPQSVVSSLEAQELPFIFVLALRFYGRILGLFAHVRLQPSSHEVKLNDVALSAR